MTSCIELERCEQLCVAPCALPNNENGSLQKQLQRNAKFRLYLVSEQLLACCGDDTRVKKNNSWRASSRSSETMRNTCASPLDYVRAFGVHTSIRT
ncbi:hypothetical protein MRX96_028735 [Rhipicephalus microplus]